MADAAPAKKTKSGAKKPAKKTTHPPYVSMVKAAVTALQERGGCSRQAILKYIVAKYNVGDEIKASIRLRRALVKSVSSGVLKQVKGTGASGSFKLAKDDKPAGVKKVKKTSDKKAPTPKKKTATKKTATKKIATKKTPTKKTPTKKIATKKIAAKKTTPKKVAKTPDAKPAVKKPAAKKPAAKKAKKAPAKKATPKK